MPNPTYRARNAAIVEARRTGSASLRQLAEQYEVSVERIRQISLRGGVDHRAAMRAYLANRQQNQFNEADQYAAAILMRWIGGESVSEIAHSLEIAVGSAQLVLDEQVTDAIEAARRENQTKLRFPEVNSGPKDNRTPRDDRYWTQERCLEALMDVAARNGGRLPSTPEYKALSAGNDELPSFPTVRNRCGRWSQLRVEINNLLHSR